MNSIMDRWIQTCRRELLDRTLIRNQRHLLHALREFERFYNGHRPSLGSPTCRGMLHREPDGELQKHVSVGVVLVKAALLR